MHFFMLYSMFENQRLSEKVAESAKKVLEVFGGYVVKQ